MKCTKEYRLSFTKKAQEIVDSLTLQEKVSLMSGSISFTELFQAIADNPSENHYNHIPYPAGGLPSHGVEPMLFCDGPRGVVCGTNKSTCFPVSMLRGATFNPSLEEKIGNAIGKEIRGYKGNLFGGVCINLPYNPGWGRSQETYGEESFLIGKMGASLVKGVQEEDVMACVKHFAFNSMEISRFKVKVDCDKRTEKEVYFPHFKECIEAGAASVMSAYNLYKNVHCGHNDYLLNQVLKNDWDFDGFVMSDFVWGVRDTVEAANGGQDIEMCCTSYFGEKLVKAVEDGFVSEDKINESALRIIRTILAFETDAKQYDESVIACSDHTKLALDCALEGITLIKNENNNLPLKRNLTKKITVLGKLADQDNLGDHGSSWVRPPYAVNPLMGISNAHPDAEVIFYNGDSLEHAKSLAKESDAVIFIAGYDADDEGEYISEDASENYIKQSVGGDRVHSLGLHEDDLALITQVGPVNSNSTVVLIGGNMIMTSEWEKSVSSILMAYYPGMEGGNAIAQIIFGDANPSGKLPYVVPYKEEDLPQVNWNADYQFYNYYHGYTKLEKEQIEPLYHFGHGLSYTNFQLSKHQIQLTDNGIEATCSIENVGNMNGAEVIQLYVGFDNSAVDRPVKLLRGFQKVYLAPGEKKTVTITCPLDKIRWFSPEADDWKLEHMDYQIYLGTSCDSHKLYKETLTI